MSDGVVSLVPYELAYATTLVEIDADPEIQRCYGAFERYQPELGKRFDWVIYGRLATD